MNGHDQRARGRRVMGAANKGNPRIVTLVPLALTLLNEQDQVRTYFSNGGSPRGRNANTNFQSP